MGRLIIIKRSLLPILMYRFNSIPIKILARLFCRYFKIILKFIQNINYKTLKQTWKIIKWEESLYQTSKHYIPAIIKSLWHTQMIFIEVHKQFHRGKIAIQWMMLSQLGIVGQEQRKRKNLNLITTPLYKNQLKINPEFNVKHRQNC